MKEAFVSCFASDLELFVMKKQEAGFHYGSQVHILRQFDGFCAGQEISIPEVTRELVEAWLSSFKNCCAVTMSGKASAIRQFSLFLLANGKNAYIPGQKTHGKQRHIHVLSDVVSSQEQFPQCFWKGKGKDTVFCCCFQLILQNTVLYPFFIVPVFREVDVNNIFPGVDIRMCISHRKHLVDIKVRFPDCETAHHYQLDCNHSDQDEAPEYSGFGSFY